MSQLTLTSWQRRRLRRQLKDTTDVCLYRRTLAVLEVDHGRSVADIARMLGMTRQSVYNWLRAYRQARSEEHTSELQSRFDLVCRLLLEKKNPATTRPYATTPRPTS